MVTSSAHFYISRFAWLSLLSFIVLLLSSGRRLLLLLFLLYLLVIGETAVEKGVGMIAHVVSNAIWMRSLKQSQASNLMKIFSLLLQDRPHLIIL